PDFSRRGDAAPPRHRSRPGGRGVPPRTPRKPPLQTRNPLLRPLREDSTPMASRARLLRIFWKWVALVVGLAALAFAVFYYFHAPGHGRYRLRMTAGNAKGTRHQLALRLGTEAARRNLALELVPSAGSEDALDRVNRREL